MHCASGAPKHQWTFQDGLLAKAGRDECQQKQLSGPSDPAKACLLSAHRLQVAGWSECTGAAEQQWTFQDGLLANAGRDECLHM